jgi:phosphoheptose isomerase
MSNFISDFTEAQKVLENFVSNKANFKKLEQAGQLMVAALKNKGKIISCGNGGSMSDAMHFAEELTGRFRDNRPSIAAISIQIHRIFLVLLMIMATNLFFPGTLKELLIKGMYCWLLAQAVIPGM